MTMTCIYCNKEFNRIKDRRRPYKFCSFICYTKWRRSQKKESNCVCKVCKKEFYLKPSAIRHGEGIYCSRECKHNFQRQGADLSGESYKDRYLLRVSTEYKVWRRNALKLHDMKCDKCGVKQHTTCKCCGNKIYLHVHHVKQFSPFPKERFNPKNSSVLCSKCH